MKKIEDLEGQQIGRLKVVKLSEIKIRMLLL